MKVKQTEILQVKSDRLFHDLFNQEDMKTLEWVVMQILECNYEDIHGKVTVGNIRLTRTNKQERNKYLDLIIDYKGDKIILELNNNYEGIYTRNVLYAANTLINNYNIYDDKKQNDDYYQKVVRVLLVNLNWYSSSKKASKIPPKKIHSIPYSSFNDRDYLLKIIDVNLDYYDKLCYDKTINGDKFYKLLTVENKEELQEFKNEKEHLERYSKKLINLSLDKEYVEDIMDEIIERNVAKQTAYLIGKNDGIEEGIEQGIKKGIKQGIYETKSEMIQKMYKNNLSYEEIAKYTEISLEEIKKIINNN